MKTPLETDLNANPPPPVSWFKPSHASTRCFSTDGLLINCIHGYPLETSRNHKSIFYGLPIGPRLLLKGQIKWCEQTSSSQTIVKGTTLTLEEAELWFEAICLSSVNELVSKQKIPDILAARARAKDKGIAFTKIVNPDIAISAGLENFNSHFGLIVVSSEEYVKFIRSFVQPSDK